MRGTVRAGAVWCALAIGVIVVAPRLAANPLIPPTSASLNAPEPPASLSLTSSAFKTGEPIPVTHTCDGENTSPPLAWSGAPKGVKSYAVIVEDVDAPADASVRWVLYNVPPNVTSLTAGMAPDASLNDGAKQGINAAGTSGYTGPCPATGTHRVVHKLYAVDSMLTLPSGASKRDVEQAMQGHILAQAQLVGTYGRAPAP